VAVSVPVACVAGLPVPSPVGEGEPVGEAEHEGDGDAELLGELEGEVLGELAGEALLVGGQLVLGEGEHDADADADADEVGPQLVVAAPATPPNGPVSATTATEATRAAAPAASATSPARCSFSQLIGRARRKIVTIPQAVWLARPGSQVPRSSDHRVVTQMAAYLDNHRDSG